MRVKGLQKEETLTLMQMKVVGKNLGGKCPGPEKLRGGMWKPEKSGRRVSSKKKKHQRGEKRKQPRFWPKMLGGGKEPLGKAQKKGRGPSQDEGGDTCSPLREVTL